MRRHPWLPLLALGFGLAVLAAAPAPAADKAEKPDDAKIANLVKQLGSDDFDDREKASTALDAVGAPALDALRQAAKSTDEEVRKRAEILVGAIEKRMESVNALAPKRVHLVYKDTPVKEAVEDFKKKTGYSITLQDPDNKLKDRTVTLDTGDVTFWQAFDQFCAKSGLKEAEASDLAPAPGALPGGVPVPLPGGGPVILPKPLPAPLPPVKEGAAPAPQPPQQQAQAQAVVRTAVVAVPPVATPPANPPATPAAPPAVGAPIFVAPGGPGIGIAVPPGFGVPVGVSDEITLVDGKSESLPTDASSAVRIRALAKADQFGPAPDGELLIGLRLSIEPRMQWQNVEKVTISKAVDDLKQALAQTTTDATPANPVGGPVGFPPGAPVPPGAGFIARPLPFPGPFPGMPVGLTGTNQDVAVHLKKGDKAGKSLAELTGTVTAKVLGEATPVITATEILKAGGKSFKGGENGLLKIAEASKNENGQITVRLEIQAPTDVVPVNGNNNGLVGPGGPIFPVPIKRLPVPLPVPPAPAAPPGAAPAGGAGAGAGGAAVGIAIAPGGIVVGPGFFGPGLNPIGGLSLVDDKGNPIKQVSMGTQVQVNNGVASIQYVLTFQADKGQEASKMVYTGRKMLSVEIPFSLKDVPLP